MLRQNNLPISLPQDYTFISSNVSDVRDPKSRYQQDSFPLCPEKGSLLACKCSHIPCIPLHHFFYDYIFGFH